MLDFLSHSKRKFLPRICRQFRVEIACTEGLLIAHSRLMAAEINARLSRPDLLPSVLQAIRSALFPDNALAAARVPPTSAETAEIKRVCASTIVEVIPKVIRNRYFGTADLDLARQDVEKTLDLFADSYINKHLIISAVELIVVRLFPELGEDDENE
jgi:hypothetical protein